MPVKVLLLLREDVGPLWVKPVQSVRVASSSTVVVRVVTVVMPFNPTALMEITISVDDFVSHEVGMMYEGLVICRDLDRAQHAWMTAVVVMEDVVMAEEKAHWYLVSSQREPQREPIGQQPALVMLFGLTMHLVRIYVSGQLAGRLCRVWRDRGVLDMTSTLVLLFSGAHTTDRSGNRYYRPQAQCRRLGTYDVSEQVASKI